MANPAISVDTSFFNAQGFVRVTWTNGAKGTNWYSWRVYRRPSTASGKWSMIKEILYDTSSYTWDDYLASSYVPQDYIVVRVYLASSIVTEEARTPVTTVTPMSDNFWLIHPYNSLYNLLLRQVTADGWSMEADVGEMQILNRGRRADHSTVWGRKGTITCQLRGTTAAGDLDTLEAQVRAKSYYWLRNPFQDMVRVLLSGLAVTRIAGTGIQERADVTFAYSELVA